MFQFISSCNPTMLMQVFDAAAKPIVDSVLDGFNGTIFAYGQTGSGQKISNSRICIHGVRFVACRSQILLLRT